MSPKQEIISIINQALSSDEIPISASWHNEALGYPQVTVTQISRRPVSYSDDTPDLYETRIQIDIWSKQNPLPIARKIETALKEQDIYPQNEREQNEPNVNRAVFECYCLS